MTAGGWEKSTQPSESCRFSSPISPGGVGAGQVHFIEEEEGRDVIPAQQLPQGFGMRLDPVGATDDQNGVIQHLEGALRLCGEVYVSGGVQKGHGQRASLQTGLFGEDGDPLARSRL